MFGTRCTSHAAAGSVVGWSCGSQSLGQRLWVERIWPRALPLVDWSYCTAVEGPLAFIVLQVFVGLCVSHCVFFSLPRAKWSTW